MDNSGAEGPIWDSGNATDFYNWTNNSVAERDAWEHWSALIQERAAIVSLLLLFSMTTVFGNTLVSEDFSHGFAFAMAILKAFLISNTNTSR